MAAYRLLGGDKAMIEMIVGRYHVGEDTEEVRAKMIAKLRNASPQQQKAAGDYAVKVHLKNRGVYNQVMTGRFR